MDPSPTQRFYTKELTRPRLVSAGRSAAFTPLHCPTAPETRDYLVVVPSKRRKRRAPPPSLTNVAKCWLKTCLPAASFRRVQTRFPILGSTVLVFAAQALSCWSLAQTMPAPGLSVAGSGANQYLVAITNAAPGTNYS